MMEAMEVMVEADLHTHTVGSGHAFGTVMENVRAAHEKGLRALAITDHGPGMADGPRPYYFRNLHVLPQSYMGVMILKGVEGNIAGSDGSIDLPSEIARDLDLVIAGLHPACGIEGRGLDWNTQAMTAAIRNPLVDIIAHPGNPQYPVDLEACVLEATRYDKALEINENSFFARPGSMERCLVVAKLCAQHGTLVSVASDAHSPWNVGEVSRALKLALDAGIRREQIVNASMDNLTRFLTMRRKRLEAWRC